MSLGVTWQPCRAVAAEPMTAQRSSSPVKMGCATAITVFRQSFQDICFPHLALGLLNG